MDSTTAFLEWLGSPDGEPYADNRYQLWQFHQRDMAENDSLDWDYAIDHIARDVRRHVRFWQQDGNLPAPLKGMTAEDVESMDFNHIAKAMDEVFKEWLAEEEKNAFEYWCNMENYDEGVE